jgi:hypothetical protein
VGHDLRAERLAQGHGAAQPPVVRRSGRQGGVLEALGSDAHDDGAAGVAPHRRAGLQGGGAERHPLLAHSADHPAARLLDLGVEHVHGRAADEACDEQVHRAVVDLLRGVDLLQPALAHHRDPVAHGHGLDLVVGDVDRGGAEVVLHLADLGAHLHAQLRVEVGERLVHQEDLRPAHDRPPHGHPLALPAGQRPRPPVEVLGQAERVRGLAHAGVDLALRLPPQPQAEGDVVVHLQVRVERVALEDHRDVAVLGGDVVHDPVADPDCPLGDGLEPGDHPQRGRLSAARRPHQHHELAVLDPQVEVGDRPRPARVDLADVLEIDARHSDRRPGGGRGGRLRCRDHLGPLLPRSCADRNYLAALRAASAAVISSVHSGLRAAAHRAASSFDDQTPSTA